MTETPVEPTYSISMPSGDRSGDLEYREGSRVLVVPFELSGTEGASILLAAVDARYWTEPAGAPIDTEAQLTILERLRGWLAREGIPTDLDRPADPPLDQEPCASRGCQRRRMRGSAFCPHHYDLQLLRSD